MILLLVCAMSIASGKGAQLGDIENCDSNELKLCVELIPRTPVGLPRTKDELDLHCSYATCLSAGLSFGVIPPSFKILFETRSTSDYWRCYGAYQTGMSCMDSWIKRCLPTDGQKFVQKQIGGARALMRFLCTNETALRKEFLKELSCWSRVSPDWSQCVGELQDAVREISDRAQQLMYFNRNAELCCARDAFILCVGDAGRSCTNSASTLLRRMAWVLAQDVAACSQQPRAYCSAPPPPYATPLLTALYGMVMYPPRL